ncbi:MAG: NAD-dependent DNA ligase LigA [Bacteroidota bacterium]|nr:NAD-dependent DNA ligase LigA [Bacteroidota bacterium]
MYTPEQTKHLESLTKELLGSGAAPKIDSLRQVLRFHEYRYYILNDPLISDSEYDQLYKKLEKAEEADPSLVTPDSPTQRVGNSLNPDFVTVPHLAPMLSLENSYNEADLVEWDRRVHGLIGEKKVTYSAEPKFDGAGISLIYEDDLLLRGATRGDGVAGDDITTNVKQIGSVPLSARFSTYGIRSIEIRGEILLTKANFREFNKSLLEEGIAPLANPRNAAAGSLRMKDPAAVRKRKLEAILYHVSFLEYLPGHHPRREKLNTHTGCLQMLADLGFKTPMDQKVTVDTIARAIDYCEEFEKKRDTLPYEIDGIVIKIDDISLQQRTGSTAHHPRWAIAFKFKARQATSILETVEFQVGRTGSVTPVAKIRPVPIGGVTVSSVSLFNEDQIKEKDLRLGDTVIVERAGDVIPYIVKSLPELRTGAEKPVHFPKKCPVCGDPLVRHGDEAVWRCVNISCEAQVVEKIIHFVSKDAMDIRSLGEANIRKFFALGLLKNIPGIYTMDLEKVAGLEGFGKKSIDNLSQAIESSKKQGLHRLIFGLGIRYVGEATAKTLARSVKHLTDLEHYSLEDLQALKDVGSKVSESIYEFFHNKDNLHMLKTLADLGLNMHGERTLEKSGPLSGKTFLFTGTLAGLKRSEAEKMVEDRGGRLLSSVSANLNFLVTGADAGSKLEKARKLKTVRIINEEEFLNMVQT